MECQPTCSERSDGIAIVAIANRVTKKVQGWLGQIKIPRNIVGFDGAANQT